MRGPRVFALVVLLALALLPKTGWVLRDDADLIVGRWSVAPNDWLGKLGPIPAWAFERRSLDDPLARALVSPLSERRSYLERWNANLQVLSDPVLGPQVRGPLLRRSLTAAIVRERGAESGEKRAFARTLLPVAQAGERADRDNAFYPATVWCLETILGDSATARAALERAALCGRYDGFATEEARLFDEGFERQYGYRGSLIPFIEGGQILLPELTSMRNAATRALAGRPLDDPTRRAVVRLGETMMRTGPTLIEAMYGRSLVLRAVGASPKGGQSEAYAAFLAANPGMDGAEEARLVERMRLPDAFEEIDWSVLSPTATLAGAAALLGLLGAMAAAWPARQEVNETFAARLRRASWAWLGLVPVAFYDGGEWATTTFWTFAILGIGIEVCARRRRVRPAMVLGGVACLIGVMLAFRGWALPVGVWASAVALPLRWRPVAWAAGLLVAAGMEVGWAVVAHDAWMPLVGFAMVAASLRLALPIRKGLEWVPAALAALTLGGVVAQLRSDGQVAEIVRQVRSEASRFRAEKGI